MRPWTIDADDIQIAKYFDARPFHRTSWIADFLDQPRYDEFVLLGDGTGCPHADRGQGPGVRGGRRNLPGSATSRALWTGW
jgi:hypothetical protein